MTPNKWQKLISQLEIVGISRSRLRELDMAEFESQTGIILPLDYKDFCGIFDGGRFNEFVTIYDVASLNQILESDRKAITFHYLWEDDLAPKRERFCQFINSALPFADGSDNYSIYWDLTTYSEQDKNYDIYVGTWDNYDLFKIGRDFFTFVTDYCLGMKSFDFLPKRFRPKRSDFSNLFEIFSNE